MYTNAIRNALAGQPEYQDENSLAQILAGYGAETAQQAPEQPMLLAGNGLSFNTNRALNSLNRETAPPPAAAPVGVGTSGQDSQTTQEWRSRNAPAQNRQLEELLLRRKLLEQQLRRANGRG